MMHDDNTMDVEIDGKIEKRPYSLHFRSRMHKGPNGPFISKQAETIPETYSNELVINSIGSDVPLIVKVE